MAAQGLLEEWELAHLLGAEGVGQPLGFGVDAPAASGLLQQGAQLGEGQFRGAGRRADDAALGGGEAVRKPG